MCGVPGGSRIDLVVFRVLGRLTMLHWSPRLVALAAALILILSAIAGGAFEQTGLNLYW
jgi:hypothetical protein